jgi:hypothetical protein
MDSLMLSKVGRLAETLPTLIAYVGPFSSVNSLMLNKL